jgi:hypothetical protein
MTTGYKVVVRNAFKSDATVQITFTQDTSQQKSEVLLNASLSKKMYAPSCLEVEIQTEKDIESFRKKLITLSNEDTTLAKDYYIFNIKQKKGKVILTAYSIDYFLTIDKFCQAFTAKTLVDGIIKPSLQKSISSHYNKFREILSGEENGNIANCVVNKAVNFKDTVIPYTVQYNESFYDFMVRICNRDGEFLYFGDDNRLHVGLEETDSVSLDSLKPLEIEYIESYNESNETNWSDTNYLMGSDTYSRSTKTLNVAYGVLSPEYLEQINTDEYSSWQDFTHPFSEVCTTLRALAFERTLKDSLQTAGRVMAINYSHYALFEFYFNYIFQREYPKGKLLYSSPIIVTEEEDALTRDNNGYKTLYSIQEEAKEGQLKVVTTEQPNASLGSIITYNKKSYVLYNIDFKLTSDCEEWCELLLVQQTTKGFFPLPMPEKRIRKSSAQRAVVVDNFDPARLGRVRVRYPWQEAISIEEEKDLNITNNTPWLRLASPMASDGSGFLFTPSVNDEVMIDYEDGNVERPYVCGSLYNEAHRPSLPSRSQTHGIVKSITSANGHHISFVDNAGAERYLANIMPLTRFAASYGILDQQILKGPYTKYFGGGFEIADYYGIYSITGSTHGRCINISSPFGKVNIDAFSGINIEAPMGDVKIVGKNVNIEARNNLTITSGTNIPGYFRNSENKGLLLEPVAVANKVTGIDFSFIRTYAEVILRPIGGNMLIKSNRYLCLEAGDGKTIIERERANNKFSSFLSCTNNESVGDILDNAILNTRTIYRDYCYICERWEALSNRIKEYRNSAIQEVGQELVMDMKILSEAELNRKTVNFERNDVWNLKVIRNDAMEIMQIYNRIFSRYELKTKDIKSIIEEFAKIFESQMKNWNKDEEIPKTFTRREVLYKEIKMIVDSEKNLKNVVEMDDWSDGINIEDAVRAKDNSTLGFESIVRKLLKKATGIAEFLQLGDERAWTEREKGAILFSDNKNNFFKIANDGSLTNAHLKDYNRIILNALNSIND